MKKLYFTLCLLALSASFANQSFASAKSNPSSNPNPRPSNNTGNPSPNPSPTDIVGGDAYSGPYLTTQAEYHLPATTDNQVLSGVQTEEWAAVYRPLNMGSTRHPVLIFLHGNHQTCGKADSNGLIMPIQESSCQYTSTGQCGSNEAVIPSHLGYGYLANRLASFGYVVVSINANLGITCGNPVDGDSGLVLARGRLVLRHLALLSQWNQQAGTTPSSLQTDFYGKLDLSQVGLLGHSRGGEGVRAAYNLYQTESHWQSDIGAVGFKGIFEIGPVDGQSNQVLNASNTAWNVLLPMCDGDVRTFQGMKPYDRMLSATGESPAMPKSMFAVWGANHNFYNSYWQSSDSTGCLGSTPLWSSGDSSSGNQQYTAIVPVLSFFRSHVGAQAPDLATVFNPLYSVPDSLTTITPVDRTYIISPNASSVSRMETFQGANGVGSSGIAEDIQSVTVAHTSVTDHDASLKAAEITWSSAGSFAYYQDNWSAPGAGTGFGSGGTLDFRVSRAVNSTLNPGAQTDFTIQLVSADGSLGQSVRLSQYLTLVGPLGSAPATSGGAPNYHINLPTVRIPLTALGSLSSVRGVRFTFDSTNSGDIYISDIDVSSSTVGATMLGKNTEIGLPIPTPMPMTDSILANAYHAFDFLSRGPASVDSYSSSNQIARIDALPEAAPTYEVELESSDAFPVRDALPVLRLNGQEVSVGSFSPTGDLHSMTFKVKASDLLALPSEFEMDVGHHEDPQGPVKSFGMVSKAVFH